MLHSLSGLCSLRKLELRNCNLREGDLPSDVSCLPSLEKLELGGNNFISIHVFVSGLSRLQYLGVWNCKELKSLPERLLNPPKEVPHLRKGFDIVMPGSEIPKWFSHQTVDSSIKIQLPYNIQNDSRWIGVIFLCIFVNDDASRDEELTWEAVIRRRNSQAGRDGSVFRGGNAQRVTGGSWIFSKEYIQPIIKDHLYVNYLSPDLLYPFYLEDKCGESVLEDSPSIDCSNKKDLEDTNGSVANGALVKRKHSRAPPNQYLGILSATDMGNFSNHPMVDEFNTVQDFEFQDMDDNHVGININTLHSNASVPAANYTRGGSTKQNLTLKSGKLIQAWIDYDFVENVMNVTSNNPTPPILSLRWFLSFNRQCACYFLLYFRVEL
ncbi:hypothetical protein V6N12_007072 [Hibiscus sabdariffa]|uniref:Uncharacterized protein n=2 Tax=Hibiscus sabdariffa TaxID=183260 RepID=A0ABR2F0P6_9ROSI